MTAEVDRTRLESREAVLERAASGAAELKRMGLRALGEAPGFTHRGMHLSRWRILHQRFG